MKDRNALQVAIVTLSSKIDDMIVVANECIRLGDTKISFDAMQTVIAMTQARTKLRGLLERVEREA